MPRSSTEMTDCGCDKAKAELEEYLHNELCRDGCLRHPRAPRELRRLPGGAARRRARSPRSCSARARRARRRSCAVQVLTQIRPYQSTHTVA